MKIKKTYATHPQIACRLLEHIDRLDAVAAMVRDQLLPYIGHSSGSSNTISRQVAFGAQLLHVALDYDQLRRSGKDHTQALEVMSPKVREYNPEILQALHKREISTEDWILKIIDVTKVEPGMLLNQNIYNRDGHLLLSRFQEISPSVIERLQIISEDSKDLRILQVLVPLGQT